MYKKLITLVIIGAFGFVFAANAAVDAAADTSSLSTGAKVGIAVGATALVGGAVTAIALAASDKSGSSDNASPNQANNSDNIGPGPDNGGLIPDKLPLIPLYYPDQPLIPLNPAIMKLHYHMPLLPIVAPPFDKSVVMGEWNDQAIYDGTPNTSQDGKFTRYIANTSDPIPASADPIYKDRQQIVQNVTFNRKILHLDVLAYTFLQVQPRITPDDRVNPNAGTLYFADPWSDVSRKGLPWLDSDKDNAFCQDAPTKIICNYAVNGQEVPQYGRGNFEAFSHIVGQPGFKKVFAVGGPGHSIGILGVLENSDGKTQERFITSAIEILQHYKLDGIDIDFELPYGQGIKERGTQYAAFLQKLRNALDQQFGTGADRKLILITIPADQRWIDSINTGYKTPDNWALISDAVNAVVVRTYDFHGGFDANGKIKKTGYTISTSADAGSPYSDQPGGKDYSLIGSVERLSKDVPYNKIIASIPAYGRAVQNVTNPMAIFQPFSGKTPAGDMDTNGCYSNNTCTGKFSYKYIVQNVLSNNKFITTDNLTVYGAYSYYVDIVNKWSPPKMLPPGAMLQYATPFISYADTSVVAAAVKYAKSAKLGGMMLANISGDVDPKDDASNSLLVALDAIR